MKKKQKCPKINHFQLALVILLDILVVIVALIIYHEVFRKPKQMIGSYADIIPIIEEGKIVP